MNMMMPTVMRMIKNVPLTLTRTRFSRAPALHTKTPPSLLVRSWQKMTVRGTIVRSMCVTRHQSSSTSINQYEHQSASIVVNKKYVYWHKFSQCQKVCVCRVSPRASSLQELLLELTIYIGKKINRSNFTSFLLIKDSKNHISISKVCWNYSQDWCQVLCKN